MTTLLTGGGTPGTEALDDDVDLARDRALVTRAQGGERGAFDDLYMRYYRRLYRFCLRRLHDSYEAEDVAQEAFVRAWPALPTFGGDRRFYPWLSVIASHLCTDVLRRRNRSTPVAEFHQSNVASTDDGGEEIMLAAVDSNLAAKAFTRLSDRHQRILKLREGSGWSYQRIADHEGVGITAVETLLWRARQALKREFASVAGADTRLGAWIGGALSLASLRRLVRLPTRVLHKVAATADKSGILAAGSVVAATAMILGAALSPPAPSSATTSAPSGSAGGVGHQLAPLVSITPLPRMVSSSDADVSDGSGGAGSQSASTPNPIGRTSVLPGTPGLRPPSSTANPLTALVGNTGGTLSKVISQGGDTVEAVTNGAATTIEPVVGGAGVSSGSGAAAPGSGSSQSSGSGSSDSPGSTLNDLSQGVRSRVDRILGGS